MPNHRRTSQVLEEIAGRLDQEDVTVRDFIVALGERSFGLAILIFALPNSLPIPGIPGFSTLTGLPILFIGLQMMMGQSTLWLPDTIARKRLSRKMVAKVLAKSVPTVRMLEKLLRPRMAWVFHGPGERMLGLLIAVLAGIIALPIPLGNFLPGVSMSLLALGLLERDGAFISGATVFALGTIVFMSTIIALFFKGAALAFHKIFS